MVILNVFFDVKQEHEADFLKLLNHMVVESNREQGCSYYQLWRSAVDPYSYSLIEHWDSQEELNAHGRTAHWINFNDTVNEYLKSNYEEHHYSEIPA
ncbi:putative quinol monooxygenase [Brevibacterium atlanticum]|uniref:putative quinol monooxygenase n=1 Tax=Brevibacterium atlanticum TaxID=2697563 RepID=UPI001423614D|nr:putative quinol monooxygenase [Brevibacterium atlanticum]